MKLSNGLKDIETINSYVYTYDFGNGKTVLRVSVKFDDTLTFDSMIAFLKESNGNFTIEDDMKLEGFNTDIELTAYQYNTGVAEFEVTKESDDTKKMKELQTQINTANLAIAELYEVK